MMKKIFFLIFLLCLGLVFWWQKNKPDLPGNLSSPAQTTPPSAGNFLTLGGVTYQYYFYQLKPKDRLRIIPNFESRRSAATVVKENHCDFAINAGFYTEADLPLGLFFADNRLWTNFSQGLTFNGFLALTKENELKILTADEADDLVERIGQGEYQFVFQTGPLYRLNSGLKENFIDQKVARRHLVAKDEKGNFYFWSVFKKDTVFNGPRLGEIQAIFNQPEIKKIAEFQEVLNLDGGAASFFSNGEDILSEASLVGSIICGTKTALRP